MDHNVWNELSDFTKGSSSYDYAYDVDGLRISKSGPSTDIRYYYDDNARIIAESTSSGQVTAQIIWGNQALARKIGASYYYYLYNGHGDVVQIVNEAGSIVNSYSYDEWGNITSQTEGITNELKYCGEPYDTETGLYYLRARYYDPTVGRFISEDSNEGDITNPLSLNLYTYVENNPLFYIDPSGHDKVWIREIASKYGASVGWEAGTQTAVVTTKDGEVHYFPASMSSANLKDGKMYIDDIIFKCAIGLSTFEIVTGQRTPDAYTISGGTMEAAFGYQGTVTVDRYTNVYTSGGRSHGASAGNFSVGAEWIAGPTPSEKESKNFYTGPSLRGEAAYWLGGSVTRTANKTSYGIIVAAPQADLTPNYGVHVLNINKTAKNIWTKIKSIF